MSTYHVKKTGNDSTGDGSDGSPWLTITASVVKLSAGDILEVHTGTYTESVTPGGFGGVSWVSGTSGSRITIRAFGHTDTDTKGVSAGTDAVVIKPSSGNCIGFNKLDAKYITMAGFVLDGATAAAGGGRCLALNNDANNLIFRNMEMKDAGADGIETSTSNGSATTDRDNLFQYLYIHDIGSVHTGNAKHGVYNRQRGNIFEHLDISTCDSGSFNFWYGTASESPRNSHDCIVRYCILRENMIEYHFEQCGIFIGPYMTNLKVHNNLIYRHKDKGISLSTLTVSTSSGHKIYNNTIADIGNGVVGAGEYGVSISSNNYSSIEIKNNLFYDIGGSPINDPFGIATTANNFLDTADPNFNDYTQGTTWDFSLTESTPSSISSGGLDLGSEYYDDFAGETRSGTFSIGAYKTAAAPDPPLPPVLGYPVSITTAPNSSALFELVLVQDNNDPDVGNYDVQMVLYGSGTLNDGT